jgi:hypothetical protein
MKKRLTATKEQRAFLAKAFNCTERTVCRALAYESTTEVSEKIRQLAAQRGCKEICVSDTVETFHDSDNIIRQYFPNGAKLELNKLTGSGVLYFGGKEMERYESVMIADIANIQKRAMAYR